MSANNWFKVKNGLVSEGNVEITGSITSNSITSSLQGTASVAVTASYFNQRWLDTGSTYPITSSWAVNARTASFIGTGTDNYLPKWSGNTLTTASNILDNGTNVGIGTASPTAKLHIDSVSNDGIALDADSTAASGVHVKLPYNMAVGSSGTGYPRILYNAVPSASSTTWKYIGSDNAYAITFGGASGNRMQFDYAPVGTAGNAFTTWNTFMTFISGSGYAGIGTTSPAHQLDVFFTSSNGSNVITRLWGNNPGGVGSSIVRIGASTFYTDIEQNYGSNPPFRWGSTFVDTIIANSSSFTNGPYGSIHFATSGSSRMVVGGGTIAGRVGINTVSPQSALHVVGHISASGFGSGSLQGTSSWASNAVGMTGNGISNYAARWTGTSTLGTGGLRDNGTQAGVGLSSSDVLFYLQNYLTSSNGTFRYNLFSNPEVLISASMTSYFIGIASNLSKYHVSASVTQSGYALSIDAGGLLTDARNQGRLATLYCQRMQFGPYLVSGSITNAFGLNLQPYCLGGHIDNLYNIFIPSATTSSGGHVGTITNQWGIYSQTIAPTYFAGNVGIATTSPAHRLQVGGTSGEHNTLCISAGGSGATSASLRMGTTTRDWEIEALPSAQSYRLSFDYIGTNAPTSSILTLGSTGRIGVGTGAPRGPLHVVYRYNNESPSYPFQILASDSDDDTKYISLGYTSSLDAGVIIAIDTGTAWKPVIISPQNKVALGTTQSVDFTVTAGGNTGPSLDNLYDLGSTSKRWKQLHGTASFALTASFAISTVQQITSSQTTVISASWASSSLSSSNARTASYALNADTLDSFDSTYFLIASNLSSGVLPTGRLTGSYNITSSWATNALTASNADTLDTLDSTYFLNASNLNAGVIPTSRLTGSYSITSSWATNAITANTATTAGDASTLDSLDSTYYLNASNLDAGVIRTARLTGSYSITSSWASKVVPNSVALGTDTTGDYVANVNVDVTNFNLVNGTGEGSQPTISLQSQITVTGITASLNGTAAYASNANLLDSLDSTYFTNASNLGSGVIPTGRLTGSYAITSSWTQRVVANSVTLGADTVGNYVAEITAANANIGITNGSGEGVTTNISLNNQININGVTASLNGTAAYASNADLLDGQHGTYFTNASNLNAGTLPVGRLTGTYSITSSWATTASYFNQRWLNTGSTYPITSSWAVTATSLPYPYLRSDTFTYNYPEAVSILMTNSILTMSFSTATGSNGGFLSSTDWTKFNNKQNALGTGSTYPITSSWATNVSSSVSYINSIQGVSWINRSGDTLELSAINNILFTAGGFDTLFDFDLNNGIMYGTASRAITASCADYAELANTAAFASYATDCNTANSSTFSDIAQTSSYIVSGKVISTMEFNTFVTQGLTPSRTLNGYMQVTVDGATRYIPLYI